MKSPRLAGCFVAVSCTSTCDPAVGFPVSAKWGSYAPIGPSAGNRFARPGRGQSLRHRRWTAAFVRHVSAAFERRNRETGGRVRGAAQPLHQHGFPHIRPGALRFMIRRGWAWRKPRVYSLQPLVTALRLIPFKASAGAPATGGACAVKSAQKGLAPAL